MLPLRATNGVLEVACADPAAPELKKKLEDLTGCPVSLRLASKRELQLTISRAYLSGEGYAGSLLGELLVETPVISQSDLDIALGIQITTGQRLGEILQDLELISAEKLAEGLQEQANRQTASLR